MVHLERRTLEMLLRLDLSSLSRSQGSTPLQLISDTAEVFCNAVRLRLLACHWPGPAILQLYTLACCVHEVSLPGRK